MTHQTAALVTMCDYTCTFQKKKTSNCYCLDSEPSWNFHPNHTGTPCNNYTCVANVYQIPKTRETLLLLVSKSSSSSVCGRLWMAAWNFWIMLQCWRWKSNFDHNADFLFWSSPIEHSKHVYHKWLPLVCYSNVTLYYQAHIYTIKRKTH